MKRNKTLRIAAIALVMALLTTCGMTGTLAKYVTDATGTAGTVRAGIFKIYLDDKDLDDDFEIELSTTLYDQVDDGTETEAEAYDDDAIIVPGSYLTLDGFEMQNLSEVDVKVEFELDEEEFVASDLSDRLQIGTDLDDMDEFDATAFAAAFMAALEDYEDANGDIVIEKLGGTLEFDGTVPIYILWDFDDDGNGTNDEDDSLIGTGVAGDATLNLTADPVTGSVTATDEYKVSIPLKITVTQID